MKIKAIVLAFVLSLLALGGIAWANTGLQTTSYSTNNFSAQFNGPVTAGPVQRSQDNQSSNYVYTSFDTNVGQGVIVRFVDHDIPVDQTSSDFYANDDTSDGTITNQSTGMYQGHPYTYTGRAYTDSGTEMFKRTRFIIVNSREVIFIIQIEPKQNGNYLTNQPQWFDFEDSLNIK